MTDINSNPIAAYIIRKEARYSEKNRLEAAGDLRMFRAGHWPAMWL
jgi:hypothetical protein